MRVVLVGCGHMSGAWLDAASRIGGTSIVGLVDLSHAAAVAQAEKHGLGGAAIGTDLAAILRQTDADTVFDVTVPQARRGVVETALAHGCDVLTEKPMAESMADARALVEAARRARKLHAVVQNRRYIPGVRRIARFLAGGAIGDLTAIHCDFAIAPHFGGFRETMPHVLLLDMAIHTFDVARLFAGCAPASVYCHEWNPPGSWYARDAAAVAIFEMQSGALVTYRGNWSADGLPTSWESQWRVQGTRGTLLWDGHDSIQSAVRRDGARVGLFDATEPVEVPALDPRDRVDGHLGVIRDFVEAVRNRAEPETVGHENIKSLAMVFGAIESARQGARVSLVEER